MNIASGSDGGAIISMCHQIGSNVSLSQIFHLVETTQMDKAPIQKFVDYVSSCQTYLC